MKYERKRFDSVEGAWQNCAWRSNDIGRLQQKVNGRTINRNYVRK